MVRVFKCVLGVGLQLYRRCKVVIQFFQMVCIHALTLHIITIRIRSKSSKPSSSSRCLRLQKRRKEVDQDKAHTRTSSWSFTFRIWARQAPEHLRLLILIILYYYLCTVFEYLSLGVAWNPIDVCSTSLN